MQNTQNKIWNTTLYLRLSRDDGDKEESNSITGQRELLRDYISQRPEFREYAVRVDDGFSGSTFERPSFQKMIEDVKAGRTDCIIVKDLSRFGRNYLDAGEYIEKIFPFLGVRFIAVNDNYDSLGDKKASDDLIIPFKNLINEAYCRDISVKIRSQLEIKRKNGQFLGSFAAFGYLKDDQDKNRLVVDQYAADIVRDIFKWKLEGVSPQDIADALNKLGVLSPMEYKRSLGMKFTTSFKTNAKAAWSAGTVIRILKNPIYTGVLVQGKETTPSYKVHKRITKDESEWTVIADSHEAIISKIDFDSVQKVLKCDTRRSPDGKAVGLFSGMIFCGDCGASMVRKTVPAGEKKYVYYVCSAHKQDKSCSPHRMRDVALEEIVLDSVKQHISEVIDMSELLTITDTAPLRTAQAQKVQRQLDKKHDLYSRELSGKVKNAKRMRAESIGLLSIAVSAFIGILMGIWMATSKRLAVKNTLLGIATLGVSIPGFVTAILLMMVFGVWWPVLPIVGLGSPANYILPVAAQSFGQIASIARLTKSTYSEAIQMDYVTMARAKGLSNLYITARHVLKNALIPVVTYFGPAIAFLITGSFVVESIFSIPGIGREFTNAITNRDYTVVLGFSVFIGVIITVANLAVDIICSLIDPRIKLTN